MRRGLLALIALLAFAHPASAQFVSDAFTDSTGTSLIAHTGAIGATWTIVTDTGGNGAVLITDANRIRANALGTFTGTVLYTASGTPSSADYQVEADFVCITNTGQAGLILRAVLGSGTNFNGYVLQYRLFHGWSLFELNGSAPGTQIGSSYAVDMTPGQTVHAVLAVSGTSLTVTLDGTVRITGTNSTYATAGQAGVFFGESTATNSTGVHLDNFVATNSGGGGGGGTVLPSLLLLGAGD